MGGNDQKNGKKEQNKLINPPILLRQQEKHTRRKQQKWDGTPVMTDESMAERQSPDKESQEDHGRLKPEIMEDIDPENGQSGKEKRQDSAMHRTSEGSANSKHICIDL
jgi:hypothetical protein